VPPIVYPKIWTTGQVLNYTCGIEYSPASQSGNCTQTGTITLIGRESITVPAGTFNACTYSVNTTTSYPSIASNSVTRSTTWHMPDIGLIRFEATDATTVLGFSVNSGFIIVATAIQ
jgi:hypothetical protein